MEEVHAEVKGVILKSLFWSDWSNELDEGVGHLVTRLVIISLVPVLLLLVDVFLDVVSVLKPVGRDFIGESNWMVEDICPLLNSFDIIIHARASIKGVRL